MLGELVLTVGVVLIAYAFYKLSMDTARYFEERNLKYKGALSSIYNLVVMICGKFDIFELVQIAYNEYPDEAICGAFDFSIRQYMVRDPEIIKKIAVKDFENFEDHRILLDEKVDELLGNSLISMQGEKWRQMRATLSPAFTGSKMRQMFELVSECADEIVQYFKTKAANGEDINVEMKDFFSRYTNDVIATSAFGIKVNSFAEPENEFYMNGKRMMNFSGFFATIKFFLILLIPKIMRTFNIKFFDAVTTESFKSMILDTMAIRQKENIFRPDLVNMLMQVRQGKLQQRIEEKIKESQDGFATVEESDVGKATVTREWNDNEIIAQCFIFFLAGFESSSTMLSFTAHELVTNPDIQQKLYEEIAEVNKQLGGKRITYDTLQKMKYLDQVVSEALRKWPVAIQIDRSCVKDYMFDDGDKLKFKIEKGSNLLYPVFAIHRDPKYYPNPDKFDPERFSDENKHKIISGSFTPFGIGPRNCIGSRFALMEMKAILYYLLLSFSFEVNKDTQIPLKMKKGAFVLFDKGVHLQLKPRVAVH